MNEPERKTQADNNKRGWLRKLGKKAFWLAIFCSILGTFFYLTRDFWWDQMRAYVLGSIEIEAQNTGRFLPDIDQVEIILLGENKSPNRSFDDNLIADYTVAGDALLQGDDAQKVVDLWRGLRRGQEFSAMCHEPLYGLRFQQKGRLIFETTVCWGCQNYSMPFGPGGIFGNIDYGFDAKSAESQKLLSFLKERVPTPVKASAK